MFSSRHLALLALAVALAPLPAAAQYGQTMPAPTPAADALAAAMRRLGADPRDLDALLTAGELSLTLGDASAAAALFKRADQIDPMNGRVKAGVARILVQQERPGEALRYFDQAIGYGLDVRTFAGDRALAYDLIGEQERAQRDYRVSLKHGDNDEVRRRYALSLGISGKRDAALEQIDTLLRKSDRGAWRARAFILSMNGDTAGATRIATSMMPAAMAQAMQPFFTMLGALSPIDRAFAVHFGEVRPNPARLADARMAPALAALGPDPDARPVQVAALTVPALVKASERNRRRDRRRRDRVETIAARAAPVVAPRPAPPADGTRAAAPEALRPAQQPPGSLRNGQSDAPRPPATPLVPAARPAVAVREPAFVLRASPAPMVALPIALAHLTIVHTSPAPFVMLPVRVTATSVAAPAPVPEATLPLPAAPVAIVGTTPVAPRMSEDSILARIVAGITIPASELGIAPPPVRATLPPAQVAPAPPPAPPVDSTADARRIAAAKAADAKALAAKKLADDRKAATAKKAAEEKLALARKAAEEKALAAKKLAEEKKAARADPPRIWVQVAGGAHEGDLPKAWAAAKAKAPALAGRQGYSTPLRSTNRVVTGPFKTDAEAQAFVNQLGKQGVSGFTFTSTAGQKLTRLPAK